MDNNETKKRAVRIVFLWLFIAVVAAMGAFVFCLRFGKLSVASTNSSADNSASTTAPVAMQNFSGNGFSFSVPQSWYVEKNGNDSVAAYSDYAPSTTSSTASGETCKIETSVFAPVPSAGIAGWISNRLSADPSVAVVERSSNDLSVSGGTGVQWSGTIDGVPTTLVYAFSSSHAFEIAPSVVNQTQTDAGSAQCADALSTFLSNLTLE